MPFSGWDLCPFQILPAFGAFFFKTPYRYSHYCCACGYTNKLYQFVINATRARVYYLH